MSATAAARLVGFVLLLVAGLVLASCGTGGGSRPFAKVDGGPDGKSVPPISLTEVAGLPESKLQPLKDALAAAAGKRDMAIVEGAFDGEGFGLSGNFQILPDPGSIRLAYSWTLTDKAGAVLHTIAAEETVPGTASPDPWTFVTPAVLERVAAYTSESLSSRLAQMGYATQVGGLPPPRENYAMAGPGAEHEIDYETVYGPGRAAPVSAAADAPLNVSRIPEAPEDSNLTTRDDKQNRNRHQIRAVAVLEVEGASATGNSELTAAMREALALAGWPVVARPRKDALTIAGKVALGPKDGERQKVDLAWSIASPDGRVLGTIKQANSVPSGSLDGGWGDTAIYATQAAATGIFDLVKRLR
jgi:hypothetical protein